ncbi:MAG: hypothetical protein U0229_07870 [Anaeromyxobacter sp.]
MNRIAILAVLLAAGCGKPWPSGSIDAERTALADPVAFATVHVANYTAEGHVCGVSTGGQGYCWGLAPLGTLQMTDDCVVSDDGISAFTSECSVRPVAVSGGHTWQQLVTSDTATLGLDAEGRVWGWGGGTAIGLGPLGAEDYPREIPGLAGRRFSRIALGRFLACGVTTGGELVCWGNTGPVTTGAAAEASCTFGCLAPPATIGTGTTWKDVAVGDAHACALDAAGAVSCWGEGTKNQLGSTAPSTCPGVTGLCRPSPAPVQATGQTFASLLAIGDETCARTAAGLTYCWGNQVPKAAFPANMGTWKAAAPTRVNFCGVTTAGAISCSLPFISGMAAGPLPSTEKFVDLSAAAGNLCGVSEAHEAWCLGNASTAMLGTGELGQGIRTQLAKVSAPFKY